MGPIVQQLKQTVRDVLGDDPSELFYQRVDRVFDEINGDPSSASAACRKVQNMVHLFIDVKKSAEIGRRFERICGPESTDGVGIEVVKKLGDRVEQPPPPARKKKWLF